MLAVCRKRRMSKMDTWKRHPKEEHMSVALPPQVECSPGRTCHVPLTLTGLAHGARYYIFVDVSAASSVVSQHVYRRERCQSSSGTKRIKLPVPELSATPVHLVVKVEVLDRFPGLQDEEDLVGLATSTILMQPRSAAGG